MSYTGSSPNVLAFPSVYVGAYSREGNAPFASGAAPLSAAWAAANRAVYVPIVIPSPCVIRRFWWLNGATVGTNNVQVGIYDDAFVSILLGTSTLSAGTINRVQYDNVTDTAIAPGRYWLAMWCNGTTATFFRTAGAFARKTITYDEDTLTGGLPATATPTAPAGANLPVFGFTTRATP